MHCLYMGDSSDRSERHAKCFSSAIVRVNYALLSSTEVPTVKGFAQKEGSEILKG